MKRIIWSSNAYQDIIRLREFIYPKNPDATRRAIKAIRSGIKILEALPSIGRPVEGLGAEYRERLIGFGASVYVVRYRVQGNDVVVLAIRHGREADF